MTPDEAAVIAEVLAAREPLDLAEFLPPSTTEDRFAALLLVEGNERLTRPDPTSLSEDERALVSRALTRGLAGRAPTLGEPRP